MTGVYPIQRYFYFTTVFLLVFAAYLGVEAARWLRSARFPGFGWGPARSAALLGLHLISAGERFAANYRELRHEAQIQREMLVVADHLKARIPKGERPLILISDRRDEQLDWLFRDRELPNTLSFREAYYYQFTYHYPFLNFTPRWIAYLDKGLHLHWVADEFQWLNFQVTPNSRASKFDLVFHTDLFRVFQTTLSARLEPAAAAAVALLKVRYQKARLKAGPHPPDSGGRYERRRNPKSPANFLESGGRRFPAHRLAGAQISARTPGALSG